MARKTLREYLDEIERLINTGQAGSAIAHCQHILKSFPKNLATYRLLGRAYLECAQYGDAADIFLRLLSSLPDDFTAHLGLSLIREQEGKLEAAIWHMERAAEVKPPSRALQDEVVRLSAIQALPAPAGSSPPQYVASHSRVALARMYLLGQCYPQAIAELMSAERENPERYDILVFLAQAYEQADMQAAAIEASQSALQKLPFSLQANRILFEAAMHSAEPGQATPYRQRLQDLDPYWAFVTTGSLDPTIVPDYSVSLEELS
jgi:tetratricopeptide (TPR) repeat protein